MKEKAEKHLDTLCVQIPGRCVGTRGNQKATAYFARSFESFGFDVETPEFDCFDWVHTKTRLYIKDTPFEIFPSPYTMACRVKAPLCLVTTEEELQTVEGQGKILLLKGDLAREPLMPKNFPFYNPDEHKRIINLLETRGFKAVLAATQRSPEMAGGVYPFPLIEDGDFMLPSAYMTAEEGEKLALYEGQTVTLEIDARRYPAKGCNVLARKGGKKSDKRVVVCAHIDSKQGTPGAIDNATGVTVLLLLGELLAGYQPDLQVEIVALNGEDYYSNPGELLYLENNQGRFSEIVLGINIDGAGYHRGNTAVSMYQCSDLIKTCVQSTMLDKEGMIQGEPWYQGDHGLFLMNERPAVAITSECMNDLLEIAHTPKDNLAVVDTARLVNLARALQDLLVALSSK